MKFNSDRGIQSPRWVQNEIAKSDDFNFIGFKEYINTTNILATMARQSRTDESEDLVLGGLTLTHTTGMTMRLDSGAAISFTGSYVNSETWGFQASAGEVFSVMVGAEQLISVDAGGVQNRRDIIEIRPVQTPYDSKSRNFKDPVTGLVTTSTVETKVEYGFEFQVVKGTEGAGWPDPPAQTTGWIKIAEINVAAGETDLSNNLDYIRDVRKSADWTAPSGIRTKYVEGSSMAFADGATTINLSGYPGDVALWITGTVDGFTVTLNGDLQPGRRLTVYNQYRDNVTLLFAFPHYMARDDFVEYVWEVNPGTGNFFIRAIQRPEMPTDLVKLTGKVPTYLGGDDVVEGSSVTEIDIPEQSILIEVYAFGVTSWISPTSVAVTDFDISSAGATLDGSTINYLIGEYGAVRGHVSWTVSTSAPSSDTQVAVAKFIGDGSTFLNIITAKKWFAKAIEEIYEGVATGVRPEDTAQKTITNIAGNTDLTGALAFNSLDEVAPGKWQLVFRNGTTGRHYLYESFGSGFSEKSSFAAATGTSITWEEDLIALGTGTTIQMYQDNGAGGWTAVGNSITTPGNQNGMIKIAPDAMLTFQTTGTDSFQVYTWDGTDFTLQDSVTTSGISTGSFANLGGDIYIYMNNGSDVYWLLEATRTSVTLLQSNIALGDTIGKPIGTSTPRIMGITGTGTLILRELVPELKTSWSSVTQFPDVIPPSRITLAGANNTLTVAGKSYASQKWDHVIFVDTSVFLMQVKPIEYSPRVVSG
jgi:hypothetical protein